MNNNLPLRQMAILVGSDDWLERQVSVFGTERQNTVRLNPQNFAKAKNLLGQEFDFILYDARQAFNLEALAIAGGTLKAGGVLLLLFNRWRHLCTQQDNDSLRWSGEKQAISSPHFIAFLQAKVAEYAVPVYMEPCSPAINFPLPFRPDGKLPHSTRPTLRQTQIINEILRRQADIYIVTAKRGRGKSALAGLLAKALQRSRQQVILTAPNKSAVGILQDFAQTQLEFIAPDELCLRIKQDPASFRYHWLLIDEAAMIPLDLLTCLTSAFEHILCTTTIHSYEGTGRGFLLKFVANLERTSRQFELHAPLRWAENDPLERFIDDLLLPDCEDRLPQPAYVSHASVEIGAVSQQALIETGKITAFYGLLTLAHYRTSPLDLRRLFDAPRQRFWLAERERDLLGGVWASAEGGLHDPALIADICRGVRRPRGNLAAQALAFQANLSQACELRSLRISRIAVQPNWRRHGIGRRLITEIAQAADVDFLSVSFGFTEELVRFWQKCGFDTVYLSEHKEASSGCYAAIALRPLSAVGKGLAEKAARHFRRNIGFSFHPLAERFGFEPDWHLTGEDWAVLQNFADFNRTLSSSLGAIRRLLAVAGGKDAPQLTAYCSRQQGDPPIRATGKKQWLRQCRSEVKILLLAANPKIRMNKEAL